MRSRKEIGTIRQHKAAVPTHEYDPCKFVYHIESFSRTSQTSQAYFDQLSGQVPQQLPAYPAPGEPQPPHSAVPPIVPPMPATPAVHLTSFPLPAGPGPRRPQKSRGRRSSPERTWRGTVAQISNVWWFLRPMVELISSVPPQKDLEKV